MFISKIFEICNEETQTLLVFCLIYFVLTYILALTIFACPIWFCPSFACPMFIGLCLCYAYMSYMCVLLPIKCVINITINVHKKVLSREKFWFLPKNIVLRIKNNKKSYNFKVLHYVPISITGFTGLPINETSWFPASWKGIES